VDKIKIFSGDLFIFLNVRTWTIENFDFPECDAPPLGDVVGIS